jgi:hypothetical protein
MSSTDEDHSDGKNKSENETLVQRVRQRVISAIKKIERKHLRRGKPELFGNTLTCEISQLVNIYILYFKCRPKNVDWKLNFIQTNDAECDKELERDVSNFENGSYGKDIR